jgi:HlyD family secretion protein
MRRAIIILLVLVVVVGIGVAGALYLKPDTYSVAEDENIETVEVTTDTIIATVNAAGRLEAIETANLQFEVSGTVAKVYVKQGARVEQGALLAELDTTELEQALRLAEIDLARAEAQHGKLLEPPAQADIAAAQAALDGANANLDNLFLGASEADIKAARVALDSAQANLQRVLSGPSTDSVTVAAAGLRKTEISLRQAQDAYNQVAYDSRSANFQGAQLEQATIDYETALANYNLAVKDVENADVLSAQSQVASMDANLKKLLEGPTEAQIMTAQIQVVQAEANLQKLLEGPSEADIIISEAALKTARVNLEKAQRNLEKARLYSPLAGTVTQVNIKENEFPPPQTSAVSLADLSTFILTVEIDEIDINRIASRQPVVVTLDSLPDEAYEGTVDEIGIAPVASASGGIAAYEVIVLIDSQDAPFRIGMNVTADIETERLEDVIVVPNRAVQIDRETGHAYVDLVVDDQTIERSEITLGRRDSTVSQVLSGLEAGDLVTITQTSRREQLRQVIGGAN